MDVINPEIDLACKLAVRSVLKNHPNPRQVYQDTLQDAYIIALSKRGSKEATTPKQFFWKVRFGLIDLFRGQTHIRCFQRSGRSIPLTISLDDSRIASDYKDFAPSYSRWLSEKRDSEFLDSLDESVERVLLNFSSRQRSWIREWIHGKTLLTIAKENGLCESRISQVVSRFKKDLRKLVLSN